MSDRKQAKAKALKRRGGGRLARLVKRLLKAAFLALLLAVCLSSVFIGIRCYSGSSRPQPISAAAERASEGLDGYRREEASTFLTLPEWYIVYNTEEFAKFIGTQPPSGFPYVASIRQYWRYYGGSCDATKRVYPFSWGNHVMLAVIGSSFSAEYLVKGLYENTIGRLTEWVGRDTPEDQFAQKIAVEYGKFMHTVPWYEFPFFSKLGQLWRETPMTGPRFVRKWERRMALTAEFGAKGIYGWLIGLASGATYGAEDLRIHAWIDNAGDAVFADGAVKKVRQLGPRAYVVTIPRYEAFTGRVKALIAQGVRFMDIAGNDEILVTALAPTTYTVSNGLGAVLLADPLLTDPATKRLAIAVNVRSLHDAVTALERSGATVEHIYDY